MGGIGLLMEAALQVAMSSRAFIIGSMQASPPKTWSTVCMYVCSVCIASTCH